MSARSSSRTVLVVDDSELACESAKHTLGRAGITVVTLNSPFGFIKAIREHEPALLLIDVGLGIMNGTKLVQLGRKNARPGSQILLYSGRDAATLQKDAAESQADGFIMKSTTGENFVRVVNEWLDRAQGGRR